MVKVAEQRVILRTVDNWDAYLLEHSGLPGRRANIELGLAVADEGDAEQFHRWLQWDANRAPTNSPQEFLMFCAVLGLGRLAAEGDPAALPLLRRCATDGRWRVREAVAMALQRVGRNNFERLVAELQTWIGGSRLEQRAAAAGLCEPDLLGAPGRASKVLDALDVITSSLIDAGDRTSADFRALRKGLGYCWSVAVVADPATGMPRLERWVRHHDPDVRWVMRQNLSKARMKRLDSDWVAAQRAALA